LRKSRKFISMPIISLEEGIQIGASKNIVVDPSKMEIAAIIIDQRGWFREQKIIPYTKVRSMGDDAITIDQSANVQRTMSLPHMLKLIKENVNPIGVKVITESGTVLGVVDEYYIDEITGKIECFEISGKFLESLFKGKALMPAEHIRTLGSDIIVVNEGTEKYLEKIDGGLNETIHNLKESTSTLWETTKKRTGKIRRNLKDKYEKNDNPLTSPAADAAENSDNGNFPEPDSGLDVTSEVEIRNEDIITGVSESAETEDNEAADTPDVMDNDSTATEADIPVEAVDAQEGSDTK